MARRPDGEAEADRARLLALVEEEVRHGGAPVAAADIELHGASARTVQRYLAQLADAGELETHRGVYWPPGWLRPLT